MKEYVPNVYDVVTLLNYDHCPKLKDLGVELKIEYIISYIYSDGSCVLYREIDAVKIEEYNVDVVDVKHLSFLYSYNDEPKTSVQYIDEVYDDNLNYGLDLFDVFSQINPHTYKVGDYVYFEDVNLISLSNMMELENYTMYKVVELNKFNNAPYIMTKLGEFELYPQELKHTYLCDEEFFDMEKDQVEVFLNDLITNNLPNLVQVAVDTALENENYELLEELHIKYIKGEKT